MPIFSYFAVIGSVLVALLFVADAKLEKRGPLPFNNESAGLPKAWQPERHQPMGSTLVTAPAPAPDMSSEAVKFAMPAPGPHIAGAAQAAETSGAAQVQAQADATPKQPKRAVRKQPHPDDDRQNYAWSPNGDRSPSGGGLFGRF